MQNTSNKRHFNELTDELYKLIHSGEVENIKLKEAWINIGKYLGVRTPKLYADEYNISPQAAHKKKTEILFGAKFIIDNR